MEKNSKTSKTKEHEKNMTISAGDFFREIHNGKRFFENFHVSEPSGTESPQSENFVKNIFLEDPLSLKNCKFKNVNFDGLELSYIVFVNSELKSCSFGQTSLDHVRFETCTFDKVHFGKTFLEETIFQECGMKSCGFHKSRGRGMTLWKGSVYFSDFRESDLKDAIFSEAFFSSVNFQSASLKNTNFRSAGFENTDFLKADLSGADIKGVKNLDEMKNIETVKFLSTKAGHQEIRYIMTQMRKKAFVTT